MYDSYARVAVEDDFRRVTRMRASLPSSSVNVDDRADDARPWTTTAITVPCGGGGGVRFPVREKYGGSGGNTRPRREIERRVCAAPVCSGTRRGRRVLGRTSRTPIVRTAARGKTAARQGNAGVGKRFEDPLLARAPLVKTQESLDGSTGRRAR